MIKNDVTVMWWCQGVNVVQGSRKIGCKGQVGNGSG